MLEFYLIYEALHLLQFPLSSWAKSLDRPSLASWTFSQTSQIQQLQTSYSIHQNIDMQDPERPFRKERSISEQNIQVPPMFESFEDLTKRQSGFLMFQELAQHTEPDQVPEQPYQLKFSLPPSEPVPQQDDIKESATEYIIKLLVLLAGFFIFLFVLYKQGQWRAKLKDYNNSISNIKYPDHLSKLFYLKSYHQMLQDSKKQNFSPKQTLNMFYFLTLWRKQKIQPRFYQDIEIVKSVPELPICIYVHQKAPERQKPILNSILASQYDNYIVVTHLRQQQSKILNEKVKQVKISSDSYFQLKSVLMSHCIQNSLLLFIDQPIIPLALRNFNSIHQGWNIYLTYSQDLNKNLVQIHSFYLQLFQLLGQNDFNKTNNQELKAGNLQVMAMGLLELSSKKSRNISVEFMFKQKDVLAYFLVKGNNDKEYNRQPYQPLIRLSQDFPINVFLDKMNLKKMYITSQKFKEQYIISGQLSISKMLKAVQLQDFIYLPKNHSILARQLQNYNSLYSTKQYLANQLPFCISILSHNNIAHNRYIKVLLSILRQEYKNYHIVFFDDMSEDDTLNKTIQYLDRVNFSRERVKFVRNLQRKYATYNILNAGFNFCGENDIQVLMDGDDELIGSYVLAMINGLYQKYPQKWMIYTNFKSNLYEFGQSKPVSELISIQKKTRVKSHLLGQLRTIKVKLLRMIPKKYHQTRTGYWLDTVYDDALQHSLFELATVDRIMYAPEICYEYNREYGDNDDSSEQKLTHRFNVYNYLIQLKPLEKAQSLDQGSNQQMVGIFKRQMTSKTFQVI